MGVRTGRPSKFSVDIGSRQTRTSIGIFSQLTCEGPPVHTSKFRSCWARILLVIWFRHSKNQILAPSLPTIFCRKHQELKRHTYTPNLYLYQIFARHPVYLSISNGHLYQFFIFQLMYISSYLFIDIKWTSLSVLYCPTNVHIILSIYRYQMDISISSLLSN